MFLLILGLVAIVSGPASAGAPTERAKHDRSVDATRDSDPEIYGHYSHQHGPSSGHLPPTQENVAVVGKEMLTTRADKISDVGVLGDFAYLGEWAGGLVTPACRGGVHVVDISNPAEPQKVGFLPSHRGTYVTEACRRSTSTPGIHGRPVDSEQRGLHGHGHRRAHALGRHRSAQPRQAVRARR